ncbi:PP2C family protein-serine/threonine phosphatase [Alloscardovia macacae]|uniref:Protein phosphatase 2C n=1 Tax=Alloscardovia macacae TaxID=1160091 RepID=A0A261F6E0_9BIFI|nr:PP2C family serine/threonine-protein phosphatase [Alloscardovia macacae]OZG54691.1 protein phosphatase 2C [Alloscardovia macacae]
MVLSMTSTTVSDIGLVRKDNQDSTFAGVRLVAVCDGMGGHAGGDTASTIAIRSLAHIETVPLIAKRTKAVEDVATMLSTSVIAAHDAIVGKAHREKQLAGMGTTVTAVALVAGYWVISHIGDSRAYMLREGEIIRVTKDHSYVQHLIDTGRISQEEAKSHPQRNVVMRVLGDFDIDPRPDISIRKAKPGDRWLLCSDGLSGSVSDASIRETLMARSHLQDCAQTLVSMALKGGSTDNVSAVIAEAYDSEDPHAPVSLANASKKMCLVGGAASKQPQTIADTLNILVALAPQFEAESISDSPAAKAALLSAPSAQDTQNDGVEDGAQDAEELTESMSAVLAAEDRAYLTDESLDERYEVARIVSPSYESLNPDDDAAEVPQTGEIPVIRKTDGSLADDPHDPDVAEALHLKRAEDAHEEHRHRLRRRILGAVLALLVVLAAGAGTFGAYRWTQTQYFISDSNSRVALYQGVNTNVFGISLSHVDEETSIRLSALPQGWRERVRRGIDASSYSDARSILRTLEEQASSSANSSSTSESASSTQQEAAQ